MLSDCTVACLTSRRCGIALRMGMSCPAGHGLVATVTYEGAGGGGQRPKKKGCVPKVDLQFRGPLKISFFS